MGGSVVSNGRKHCFQSLEAGLLMGGCKDGGNLSFTDMVDTGDYKITGLHPIFYALDFLKCIIILYIYIIIYIYVYIYTYIYIYNNKYT